MPAKKTTTKKTATAKTSKMNLTKPTTTVVANTNKTMACDTKCFGSVTTWTILLLVANTVLLLFLVSNYTVKKALVQMEVQRVGGVENYETIQKIYELDTFKEQQKIQIEQTYQAMQGMGAQAPIMMPENEEFVGE